MWSIQHDAAALVKKIIAMAKKENNFFSKIVVINLLKLK
jgi:hypothetical protein